MKTSNQTNPVRTPLKILLMGPPGARKTTLALQFSGVHVIDCDRNLVGPETYLRKTTMPALAYSYDDIRVEANGDQRKVEDCYNEVCDRLKAIRTDVAYKDIKTVVLDSLSHVNEFIIRHTLKMQNKSGKSYEMEARDWSPFKSFAYALLVGRLEETGRTIIATCHETKLYGKPTKDDMMNAPVEAYEPFFQGKVGEMIGAFFTDVWRIDVRPAPGNRTETILQADKTPRCQMLKNSIGLPPELDITKGISILQPFLKDRI